jgi:hypothetical protein
VDQRLAMSFSQKKKRTGHVLRAGYVSVHGLTRRQLPGSFTILWTRSRERNGEVQSARCAVSLVRSGTDGHLTSAGHTETRSCRTVGSRISSYSQDYSSIKSVTFLFLDIMFGCLFYLFIIICFIIRYFNHNIFIYCLYLF